ncbi:MED14-domain-containing protein [Suhomyces tanzawaensis NRRL Y-17324]|uniref:Mediator of RNA polymerase II transcription subunit 14 n=1 Tax=Suhomyces tanzawaensis NRRL Y-17324 TaxID=984487 RepID=A0A1E4SH36_9ASCO|nr:MED14-domain-containing protein [Suhomyces tanzawaensis NRRL Y-17324]ODV78821.1 MED14-domain-containing protein [Suhomyces tanzawaensis NRRL Y-17324]
MTDTIKNGTHTGGKLPADIPHITNNILPLSNILKFYTQEAYKQITTLIENLSSTKHSESDSSRKKTFLKLIISLRQDFIKMYTLVKWASNSKDVSKFIDLLNWFRMQEFHFEQLSFQLNALNSFSGAKLPNSDLITSLEVLLKGRPQLPSYNFLKVPKVTPEKTLEVLQDLNLILMTRMALTDIPDRFLKEYEIKDGRIIFSVLSEFQVAITVANDLVIETNEDYYKSPFYFVDFKFLFGINPETSLITHRHNKITTRLPQNSHEKLEKTVNTILLNQGLNGLYDLLHKYSISFKLYLIAKQLKDLVSNSKWKSSIQFNYQNGKSLIIINYWCGHYLSRNWKSFIEIGIDRSYNLNFRWFKNGGYVLDHGIVDIFKESLPSDSADEEEGSGEEESDLSVELILNTIINKHSEGLISSIYNQFTSRVSKSSTTQEDQISYISPLQLLIKLSPKKTTIFAINPATGYFYFIDPTPIQNQFTKRINSIPLKIQNKFFLSELDLINNVVESLVQLRLETYTKEIHNRLITTEWINNSIIKLNEYETGKLLSYINNISTNLTKIQFYRRKNWPSSWYLINLTNGITNSTHWWVSRIKSINGDWKVQWIQKLLLKDGDDDEPIMLDFRFFSSLSKLCSNMIIDHMILEELQLRNIKHLKVEKIDQVLKKFNLEDSDGHIEDKEASPNDPTPPSPISYESILLLYNDHLLPVYNSSTSLFLKISLINVNQQTQMKLKLFGNLRNLAIKNSEDKLIKIDESKKIFEINDLINLTSRMGGNGKSEDILEFSDTSSSSKNLLDLIFNNLNKLNELIKILDQLNKNNIRVLTNSINDITIKVDDNIEDLVIKLPEKSTDSITLAAHEFIKSDKDAEENELNLILIYMNRYLKDHASLATKKDAGTDPIVGIIKYFKEFNPIFKSIQSIHTLFNHSETMPLIGVHKMPKLNFDVKLPSLNQIQYMFYINYLSASGSKKTQNDKFVITLTFKNNKFEKGNTNIVKISLKDNLNSKNLKYKGLFELIFKAINEVDALTPSLIKLNYDFLVNVELVEEVMVKISKCFLVYAKAE